MAPTNVNQRITQLIQQLGISKNAFAQSLGKTASVIQHLVDGRNKPGYDLLFRIFEVYPNVSRDWLILGRGPLLLAGPVATPLPAAEPPVMAKLPLLDTTGEAPAAVPVMAAPRRPASGGTSTVLQPADIAATLALAAATAQPARTSAPVPLPPPDGNAPAAPVAAASASPAESALAAVLHTQYLQHQLALAELRNQHLLEQQKLLRELVDMARRA